MSSDENKAVVERLFRAMSEGDEAALDELVAPDAEIAGALVGGRGPAVYKQVSAMLRGALPDVRFTADEMVAEGERVAVRMTTSGTHRGPFMGVAPTGKSLSWAGVGLYQLREGRIARQWALQDRLGVFEQLGAAPAWERVGR
jgi:predicted ester cyclase